MSNYPNTVVPATRQVIERKLLAALDDESKVAILCSKQDLEDIIAALYGYKLGHSDGNLLDWSEHDKRCRELAKGIEQLRREAFGM